MTAGPLVCLATVLEVRRRRRQRVATRAARLLVAEVDGLLATLRAGRSLHDGCRALSAPGARAFASALDAGEPLAEAAAGLARSAPTVDVRLLAVTLQVVATHGGPAAPSLHRLRQTLSAGMHGRRRAQVEASQASASAGLLVAAPGLFAAVVAGLDPVAAHLYLFEPVGAACVTGAVVLSMVGWFWMGRLNAAVGEVGP